MASAPAEHAASRGNSMTWKAFETIITETPDSLAGPWRRPHQMLNAQVYDSHASIHDDATAQKLGFQGGTIEGPTHFSGANWLKCVGPSIVPPWNPSFCAVASS